MTSSRPWWQRIAEDFRHAVSSAFTSRREREAARELALFELDGLSAETLEDIGAPEWVIERSRQGRWSAIDPAYWSR